MSVYSPVLGTGTGNESDHDTFIISSDESDPLLEPAHEATVPELCRMDAVEAASPALLTARIRMLVLASSVQDF